LAEELPERDEEIAESPDDREVASYAAAPRPTTKTKSVTMNSIAAAIGPGRTDPMDDLSCSASRRQC
jgi:hypothetical protein